MKPLAIDLYAGLGGWTEGLLDAGYRVVGFDIERRPYPAQLVLQDVRTIHGAQFKDAALIVASPPCQEFSYRAMPWKRAKALGPPVLGINLFWQCWRIQHEANLATGFECETCGGEQRTIEVRPAGYGHYDDLSEHVPCPDCLDKPKRYIPLVVENVKGAQPWIGRARARYGSFFLWGDVDSIGGAIVAGGIKFGSFLRAAKARKNDGGSWFAIAHNTASGKSRNARDNIVSGIKQHGSGPIWFDQGIASHGSKSAARKAASAQIAKIPYPLAQHIARTFLPAESQEVRA